MTEWKGEQENNLLQNLGRRKGEEEEEEGKRGRKNRRKGTRNTKMEEKNFVHTLLNILPHYIILQLLKYDCLVNFNEL